jgi:ubiquinone biosynthesis protein COQ9
VSETAGMEASKDALLEAMLPNVLFDGWTGRALAAGAAALGLGPGEAAELFPGGGAEARVWLDGWADRRMVERLAATDLAALRTPQRVVAALAARLAVLEPHREAVRRAIAARLSPLGAMPAAQAIYRTVDTVWWAIGDASTDFSFYTKRGILAAIHGSAMLYWLNDRSDGAADTIRFIESRIAEIGRVPSLKHAAGKALHRWRAQLVQLRREARL